MKHILIPVDFSDQSWQSAICALSIYQNAGVRFYLFYSEMPDDSELDTALCVSRASDLKVWTQKLTKHLASGQVIIPLLWEGSFIENIKTAVLDNEIDLIVLSTQYPNIFCEGLEGSHTRAIIARVKCPVLIVPRGFKCTPPKEVVLLSDFNFKHRSRATGTLTRFLERLKAKLNVLQLSTKGNALTDTQSDNKSFLQDVLKDIPHRFHFMIDKTMDEALQFFIDMNKVDLVVLFAKNINLSENILFSPTLTRDQDYHKIIPFLIIHE